MIVGIIPARFASSRLLGKPLADIGGKPMIQHTYENASKSKFLDRLVIATDDDKVYESVKSFTDDVIMTPKDIATGSDRIAFVTKKLLNAEIIVNIQGDEPFIKGEMIDQAIEPMIFEPTIQVTTLAKRIDNVEDLNATSIPKVVFDYNNNAMYFSRSPIPFVRDARTNLEKLQMGHIYKHIGLYVYKRDVLLKFTELKQTELELYEKLEQLRLLEYGYKIRVVITEHENIAVDTPEDLDRARNFYKSISNGLEYEI